MSYRVTLQNHEMATIKRSLSYLIARHEYAITQRELQPIDIMAHQAAQENAASVLTSWKL